MSDPFTSSLLLGLYCKDCNRKILDRCSQCGQFRAEFKPHPKDLCSSCGQLRTAEEREETSDEESDEEEDAIILKNGTWRRKCSCCNRPRDMCTKCKRPYISDSEGESDEEVDDSDVGLDKDEEEEKDEDEDDVEDEDEDEDLEEEEDQRGSGSIESCALKSKRLKLE